eukprot:Tamp_23445.p1 GENE.Tamp_23445~~Tamp_23445.p1  ORF type:complete len:134 (+),score=15.62 Tamp_23445:550-951(+)
MRLYTCVHVHMCLYTCVRMYRSTRAEYKKAEGFLDSASELHSSFLTRALPANRDLSSPEQKQYTTTLFLQAQVYQHLSLPDESARCCLVTLDRQAQSLSNHELRLQGAEWIKNAVQLSGFFLSQDLFGCCLCV